MEYLNLGFGLVQSIGVIGSLVFVAIQLRRHRHVLAYETYQRLSREYQDLLWRAVEDPNLDTVWDPLDETERVRFDLAHDDPSAWGVWYAMNEEERRCYRFTRRALELFEQAWQVRSKGWIDDPTWEKWYHWVEAWKRSRYFGYIVAESKARLIPGFCSWLATVGVEGNEEAR